MKNVYQIYRLIACLGFLVGLPQGVRADTALSDADLYLNLTTGDAQAFKDRNGPNFSEPASPPQGAFSQKESPTGLGYTPSEGINYKLGANSELKTEGSVTWFVRLVMHKAPTDSSSPILTRWRADAGNHNRILILKLDLDANVAFGIAQVPNSDISPQTGARTALTIDEVSSVFAQYKPFSATTGPGYLKVSIYSSDGTLVDNRSMDLDSAFTSLPDSQQPFEIGGKKDAGITYQAVATWRRNLTDDEMNKIAKAPLP